MDLKKLRCLLVIMAFSMPLFAESPRQIESFDDFNNVVDPNWIEVVATNYGSYVEQVLVGGANQVTEGLGSMKFDFTQYAWPVKDDEVIRTFSPALDFNNNNYEELAITLWVWSENIDDSRSQTAGSRLREIVLYDSTVDHVGHFTMPGWRYHNTPPLKNVGWNKVIAPLRNFMWKDGTGDYDYMDPCDAEWDNITKIGVWARTEDAGDHNTIYIDDMRLEVAPAPPPRYTPPSQIASCDDINDELWDELRGSGAMLQTPPGDANFTEGTGSMMIDFTLFGIAKPDITPSLYFIPALDFSTDYNDWAITFWLWTGLVGDEKVKEIILHDAEWNLGRFRVTIAGLSEGWNKVTARLDEFLWNETGTPGDILTISPDLVRKDAILSMELWTDCWEDGGNAIYLDDFRFEPAVEALSEAVVYNADYATITVDGDASDWAGLVDSDILDFDMQEVTDPNGNLHVKYRLAWDPNYLYILVEEQPGDTEATEAPDLATFSWGAMDGETQYDSLGLWFDFTNNRPAG
ncbi:hypothetical protein ES703_71403 [subsurface metagenome]